jgi:hypothetical protein
MQMLFFIEYLLLASYTAKIRPLHSWRSVLEEIMHSKFKSSLMGCGSRAIALAAALSAFSAAPAFANKVTIGGTPAPIFDLTPLFIFPGIVTTDTVIDVDTADITGPGGAGVQVDNWGTSATTTTINVAAGRSVGANSLWGTYQTSFVGASNVVNNGTIAGLVNGVVINSAFIGDGGDVSIKGTGAYGSATSTGYGAWIVTDVGKVTIDGGSRYQGGLAGIFVDRNNPSSGTILSGDINLGMGTRLGDITGRAGDGLYVLTRLLNPVGPSQINIRTGNVTGGAGWGIRVNAFDDAVNIQANGLTKGSLDGMIVWTTTGAVSISGEGSGTVEGGVEGIVVNTQFAPTGGGNITVKDFANVTGGRTGIWTLADTGNISLSGIGKITGTTVNGLLLGTTSGNISVQSVGNSGGVTGLVEGIYAGSTLGGSISIGTTGASGTVTGGRTGIWTEATTGAISIAGIGRVTGSSQYGIYSTSTTGNISVNSVGTAGGVTGGVDGMALGTPAGNISIGTTAALGPVTGARNGIWTNAGTGNTTVSNVTQVRGTSQYGIFSTSTTGNISIQSVGTSGGVTGTALEGIVAGSINGNISVGNTGNNGVILGGRTGLYTAVTGTGNTAIDTNANVTGTSAWGILATGVGGSSTINVKAGDVVGGTRGLESLISGAGNATISVAAGSTVRGGLMGMLTGTTTGTSTINNAGLITSTNAAANTGGDAFWSTAGRSILNNTGIVTGRAFSSGTGLTFNNLAGGVWNPGSNDSLFNAASDFVNNSGLINIRAGLTRFVGLETFENRSGGIINLQLNGDPTDDLAVLNFSPLAGSRIKVNFNVDAPLGAIDRGTSGTADTITVVGTATPSGVSFIDLLPTGGRNGAGEPIALTGSVAIIYTGNILAAPNPGATLVASDNYNFGEGNPSTITRIFKLVEDGREGVYLQWVPNISAATMGGFAGGDLSSPNGKGSVMGMARGAVSGALGAASALAGQASGAAGSSSGGSGGTGGAGGSCAANNRDRYVWGQIQSGISDYKGGGSGNDLNGAIGLDAKIKTTGANECGRLSAGGFLYGNTGGTKFSGGTADSDGYGAGIYIRTIRESGLYAQLLGTAGFVENDLLNKVFRTTTSNRGRNFLVDGMVGYVRPIGQAGRNRIDLRVSVSQLDSKTGTFTDNLGFQTTFIASDMTMGQASIGLIFPNENGSSGYLRGGARYTDMKMKSVAYGVVVNTAGDEWGGLAEAGWRQRFGNGGEFHVGLFGDFSQSATGYGGRIGLRFDW